MSTLKITGLEFAQAVVSFGERAVDINLTELGGVSRELTPSELDGLDQQAAAIQSQLAGGIVSATLSAQIQAFGKRSMRCY